MPSSGTNGAAAVTPVSAVTSATSPCQSSTPPSRTLTVPCADILRSRLRNSPSNPFMTDRMTISAATPSAIPMREISVMKDTKRVRRLARR